MGTFRLFLAYLVIVTHTSGFPRDSCIDPGTIAIAVFFFISGYLMPLAFNSNYQFQTFAQRVKYYAINRLLRVYPLYWISLCLVVLHGIVRGTNAAVSEAMAHPIIYVQNVLLLGLNQETLWGAYHRFNHPSWTLDVELQYYALVPILVCGWASRKSMTVTTMLLLSAVSAYLLARPTFLVDVDRSLAAYGGLFFFGFLCYNESQLQAVMRSPVTPIAGAASSGMSFLFCGEVQTIILTAGLILIAGRLLVAQQARAFSKVDQRLGDLSYPVYIFHDFVINTTQARASALLTHQFEVFGTLLLASKIGVNIILSTIVASFIMKTVELPVERLREKFKFIAPAHSDRGPASHIGAKGHSEFGHA